ncbi:MAG: DsbA family oxidoreductase [Betaproteobacteria bacterium]|nr:DsbA family oxidoreductase [Betaproteobacteria bacterium]
MTTALKIDFVSDIACPWCAVGLGALEQALHELKDEVKAELHFQPFELNPHMPEGGEDLVEHLGKKYGSSAEQQAQMYQNIKARGAEVGFAFHPTGRGRIFNTFDAHRLLHWAEVEGQEGDQLRLKKAFLQAYQGQGEVIESHEVLLNIVQILGMDVETARAILESDTYAEEVRAKENFYTSAGIHSVPAVIINDKHLISGGQPAAVFASALRKIAAETT